MDWLPGILSWCLVIPWSLCPPPLLKGGMPPPLPKIPPISVMGKIKMLWSVAVRGAPLALGLLCWCSAMVCSAMVKPLKDR